MPYQKFMAQFDVRPDQAVFFEDTPENLASAKQLGWATCWIKASGDTRNAGLEYDADLCAEAVEPLLDQILSAISI